MSNFLGSWIASGKLWVKAVAIKKSNLQQKAYSVTTNIPPLKLINPTLFRPLFSGCLRRCSRAHECGSVINHDVQINRAQLHLSDRSRAKKLCIICLSMIIFVEILISSICEGLALLMDYYAQYCQWRFVQVSNSDSGSSLASLNFIVYHKTFTRELKRVISLLV